MQYPFLLCQLTNKHQALIKITLQPVLRLIDTI
jgi:hypothetical protein